MRTIVVGASSGLGRCIGVDRGKRGDKLALMARRLDRITEAAAEAGGGTLPIACDVTDEASVKAAIKEAADGLGGIDRLVYTPGVGPVGALADIDAATWRQAFNTNVIGAALVTAAALPYLQESRGTVVFLSSISASLTPPWPGFGAYNVSKAALDKLIDALRGEYPTVGFTRIVVGDTSGGEGNSRTEFADSWDFEQVGRFYPIWTQRGLITGTLMDVQELLDAVDFVLKSEVTIPSVTVTPRPAKGPFDEEIPAEIKEAIAAQRAALAAESGHPDPSSVL